MRTEYKRDMNHSYLILRGTEQVDTASYQIRMLAGNAVPGLLKCRLQGVDGHMDFYYEITSRQPVSALYESRKLGNEDLQLIFGGFVRVLEEMAEFLLNPENLLISPEYMYVDIEKKEMYFCYLPGYDHEVRAQLQTLTEYVLPKLDHEDGRAVMLGYGIYRRALEDSFHLEHLKEELYCVRDGEIPSELYGKKQKEQKMPFPGEDGAEPQKEKEEDPSLWRMGPESKEISEKKTSEEKEGPVRRWIRTLSGCIAAAAAVMCLVVLRTLGYLPWLTVEPAWSFWEPERFYPVFSQKGSAEKRKRMRRPGRYGSRRTAGDQGRRSWKAFWQAASRRKTGRKPGRSLRDPEKPSFFPPM